MNTIILITLLVIVIAPAVIAIVRLHDRFDHLPSVPFGFDHPASGHEAGRLLGPDAERIRTELIMLNLHRRDSA